MLKITFVVILLALCLYLGICYFEDGNAAKHLTVEYDCSHFSRITRTNMLLNPQLLFANATKMTLEAGEAVIIPSKWWYWAVDDAESEVAAYHSDNVLAAKPAKVSVDVKSQKPQKVSTSSKESTDHGLQYDDFASVQLIRKGRRRLTLYPPSDSFLLRPLSILPPWADPPKGTKMAYISPALYTVLGVYTAGPKTLPSARLLYETVVQNKALLKVLARLKQASDAPVVWETKLTLDGKLSWEVYAFHVSVFDRSKPSTPWLRDMLMDVHPYALPFTKHATTCIHSIEFADVQKEKDLLNGSVNVYEVDEGVSIKLPLFAKCVKLFPDGGAELRGQYVLASRPQLRKKYSSFMKRIGVNWNIKDIVFDFFASCKYLCVKHNADYSVTISYIGLAIEEFLAFLEVFRYPAGLYAHAATHKQHYKHFQQEVSITYAKPTKTPVRTSFYGVL